VIIELGCETDFVAKNDQFQGLVQDVADAIRASGKVNDVATALSTPMGGDTVESQLSAAVTRVGENIVLKRVATVVADGLVGGYVHGGGKLGVLVGVTTKAPAGAVETAKDLAMHIAAADPTPLAVDRSGIDGSVLEKEQAILRAQALESGKPENIVDNIVKGRINKFYAEHCLLEQPFVKDPDKKISDVLAAAGGASVTGFVRFKLGESTE
jgi:elongation factor Ts